MDDNEYGEFTKGVVMEFTQSITLKEAKNLKSPGNLMRYEHVSEFVAKYSMSTIREQAVETDVYQLSNSCSEKQGDISGRKLRSSRY